MGLALPFCRRIRARLNRVPKACTRSGRATRSAPAALTGKSSSGAEGGVPQQVGEVPHAPVSRHRTPKGSRPMNATKIAAALSTRAEDVCRRYLPRGRKQGRYWIIGDTSGAKGRSLFVRLAPPGIPGKWTDAATNEHGDLLDLIRLHTGGASLRLAMEEALAFLSLPRFTPANDGNHAGGYDREEAARRLWRRCRPINGTHAEAYLHARAIGHCHFPALRFHPDLIHRGDDGIHRLPALVAAVTGDDGAIEGVQRTWLDPKLPEKANLVSPRKALGRPRPGRALRRVRLRRDPACRRGHRNRADAGHRYSWHSCRGGSICGQSGRLRTTPRPRPVGHRPR